MRNPDKSFLYGQVAMQIKLNNGVQRWAIPPVGWTSGLIMTLDGTDAINAKVKYRLLSDVDEARTIKEVEKPSYWDARGRDMRITGMWFDEPIANVNSACPYVLEITSDTECVLAVVQLYYDQVF